MGFIAILFPHEVHNAHTVIPVQSLPPRMPPSGIHPESGALRMQYRSRTFKGVRTAISTKRSTTGYQLYQCKDDQHLLIRARSPYPKLQNRYLNSTVATTAKRFKKL